MRKIWVMTLGVMMLMCACSYDDSDPVTPTRTVLVHMSARNSLARAAEEDLRELKEGSKLIGKNDQLLVFVRRYIEDEEPWLADVLGRMPHLKFIMADCCNFMCLEVLYELRGVCDYIIGSPAEIPGRGAPYDKIVPDMFSSDKAFYSTILSKYHASVGGGYLPLSVVKTSEMQHLADATRLALQAVKAQIGEGYADMTGHIHYYYTSTRAKFKQEFCIFYDAGEFFLKYAPAEDYQLWRQVCDRAVIDRRFATEWAVDKIWYFHYVDFTMTEETYHGVSMFVPQDPSGGDYAQYNEQIKQTEWYEAMLNYETEVQDKSSV